MHPPRLRALPLVALPVALAVLAPAPSAAVSWHSADLTAPVVGVVALLAWACLCWLLLVAVLSALADLRVRGVSWLARLLVTRLAPASVRAAVALVLGGTLLTGTVAPAAWAGSRSFAPVVPAPVAPFDWPRESDRPVPLDQPVDGSREAARPTSTPTQSRMPAVGATADPEVVAPAVVAPAVVAREVAVPEVVAQDSARPAVTRTVVVRPGDCLWSIARRSLAGTPTDRKTAETWPLWWNANRQLIGDNPHLIRPGMRLTAPT